MDKKGRQTNKRTIREVKRDLSRRLLAYPNVSGVGIEAIEEGNEQIKIYLVEDNSEIRKLIHQAAKEYPVAIEVIGRIKASSVHNGTAASLPALRSSPSPQGPQNLTKSTEDSEEHTIQPVEALTRK